MPIPLAFLDAAVVEEVPVDLWRRIFDEVGWPASLRVHAESFTHADVVEAFARDEPTDDLLQFLEVLNTLGTQAGADAIQMALDDQRISRDVLPTGTGERELAVHLYLAQRQNASLADVFARAQIQVQERGEHRRYHEFLGRSARGIRQLDAKLDELRDATRAYCQTNDLGDHVQVRGFEDDGAYVFQILRSHRTRKPLAVVDGRAARATISYRPVHGDLLRYEAAVGRLRIAAQTAFVVAFYRRVLGRVMFDDEDFFTGDPVCSHRVLQENGRAVLDRHDVVGIGRVRMTECVWERGDRTLLHLRAPDCFREIEALQLPLTEGALLQAKLKLEVIGPSTRPVTVSVRAPSRIEVSQRRHEALVDRFLEEIGIRGRPGPDTTPTLWSLAPWRHPRDVWRAVFGRDTDSLIERGVLQPTRLDRVASADDPAAGRTLDVASLGEDGHYGVSTEPDLPSRTLTATDLDGFELQPEAYRQLLRSRFGIAGIAPAWDGSDAVLELGPIEIGEHRVYLAYAIRRPPDSIGEGLRQRAGGAPVVLLSPSTQRASVDVPVAPLEYPLPTREQALRAGIAAAGLQHAVPALFSAPDGVRLVVDRTRGTVWIDGCPISGLKPGTHPFRFVTLLAEAMGRPVESHAIKAELSDARRDDDTATRQAKTKANQAIREAMAAAGHAFDGDPFPTCGTGLYRCALPSFVS
jgi:hypothetical protein